MTPDRAVEITNALLRYFRLDRWHWRVEVVPQIPGHPNWLGVCSYRRWTITLAEHGLKDDREAMHTIYEEVAHAATPGDTTHGEKWRVVFERIAYFTPTSVWFTK
jgi:hypothetical protein